MISIVVLDSGPLGMLTNPKNTPENEACREWLRNLLQNGVRVIVPELADYEIRRELLRANKTSGLRRLDALIPALEYLPITTAIMRQSAVLWAQARQQGKQTAVDAALDGDMILIAQSLSLNAAPTDIIIATHNVSDIARFVSADLWSNIS